MAYVVCFPDGSTDTLLSDPENRNARLAELESVLRERLGDAFDGKCNAYIEGYRFIPSGQTWTRADGVVFTGEMIAPWKPWDELDAAQREYEREQLNELDAAYQEGVNSL